MIKGQVIGLEFDNDGYVILQARIPWRKQDLDIENRGYILDKAHNAEVKRLHLGDIELIQDGRKGGE